MFRRTEAMLSKSNAYTLLVRLHRTTASTRLPFGTGHAQISPPAGDDACSPAVITSFASSFASPKGAEQVSP